MTLSVAGLVVSAAVSDIERRWADPVDVGCGAADSGVAKACIRVAWALGCFSASGRAPELGVMQACSAWPVVSTAGVSLGRSVVHCACKWSLPGRLSPLQ